MQFDLNNNSLYGGEDQDQDLGFWDYAGDIASAPFRGIAGAAEGVYDLADWVLQDWLPDAEDNFGLGHSKTMAGGLVQGMSQFLTGFLPAFGALSKAGQALGWADKISKAGKATQWAAQFGKASLAGGIADLTVFDAHEQRLSNLLQMYPSLQNPVSEFLAADPSDTEMEGRLKNFLEGGILGFAVEPFVIGLKAIKSARSAKSMGADPEKAVDIAMSKDRTSKLEAAFPHLNAEEAATTDAVWRAMGLDVLDESITLQTGGEIGTTALRQMPDGTERQTRLLGTFTSHLTDTLRDLPQRKLSSTQLRGVLKKQGVKDEEIFWSGLDDYLKENPKVNLDEAMESIGNIRLEEVVRGAADVSPERVGRPLKWEQWTLPGGSDQRELLITWGGDPANFRSRRTPEVIDRSNGPETIIDGRQRFKIVDPRGNQASGQESWIFGATKEEALENWRAQDQVKFDESMHWSETNVIGWTRFNTRKGPKGEKVLFIEELQSDWHQQGRASGYAGDIEETWGSRLHMEENEARKAAKSATYGTVDIERVHAPWLIDSPSFKTKANAEKALNKKFTLESFIIAKQAFQKSPRIDITGSDGRIRFIQLGDRHPIGSKKLPTSVMTDRAQLSKWLGEDAADDLIEGWKEYLVNPHVIGDFKNKKHELFVFPEDVRKAGVDVRTTELGIGEGPPQAPFKKTWDSLLLKRMISHAVDNDFDAIAWTTGKQQSDRWGGQEGLAFFYDKILPKTANKIGKKFGARVTKENLELYSSGDPTTKAAWGQPYMRLTDELKASVKERGQRLFQDEGVGPKGAVDFEADGRAVISFFKSADVSTGIHEGAHVARKRLFDTSVDQAQRMGISDVDIRTAEDWAGATRAEDGTVTWSVAAEEKFARGFEKYLKTGKAPNDTLRDLFSKFAGWLKSIYDDVAKNSVDEIKISPEMNKVFDNLMSRGDLDNVRMPTGVTAPRSAAPTRLLQAAEEGGYRKGDPPPDVGETRGINLDRMVHGGEVRQFLDSLPLELKDRIEASITRGAPVTEISEASVMENARYLADALDQSPEAAAAAAKRHVEEGSAWVAAQQAFRNWGDELVDEVVEINARLNTGSFTDELLVTADMRRIQAGEVLSAAREGGTLMGVGLQRQTRMAGFDVRPEPLTRPDPTGAGGRGAGEGGGGSGTGSGIGTGTGTGGSLPAGASPTGRSMPESMWLGDTPEAAKIRRDYIEARGGGSYERGIKNIKKDLAQFDAIAVRSKADALKHMSEKSTYPQMLVEYWINSILSGPLTHAVNMTSNTLNTLFMPLEKFAGDLLTLKWDKAFGEDLQMYVHLATSFSDASTAAAGAFKNWGDTLDAMGKIDIERPGGKRAISADNLPRVANTIGEGATNWIGKALNLPSRFLMAEDAFFKNLNYRASVKGGLAKEGAASGMRGGSLDNYIKTNFDKIVKEGQYYSYTNLRSKAEAEARNKYGAMKDIPERNRSIKGHVNEYMEKNWDERHGALAKKSLEYGREITYTQSLDTPDRGRLARAAGGFNQWINDYPMFRLISPFVRTPTNLLAFYLNRTAGAMFELGSLGKTRIMKKVSEEMAAELSLKQSDILGRLSTGAMFSFGALMAVNSGTLTGGGPKDPEKRRLKEAAGWQPYSIKVGDSWWSYKRFDPFANFFGVVADIAESVNETDEGETAGLEGLFASLIFAASRNVMSKSYLTGVARFANVLAQPERYSQSYLETTVSSFLPFSGAAGQTIGSDEHHQEIRSILDALRAKYGLTGEGIFETKVESKRDMFGDKLDRPQPLFNAVPIHRSKIKKDAVLKELNKLGHGFSPPRKIMHDIDTTQFTNDSGQTFYDRWQQNHGKVRINGRTLKQAIRTLMRSSAYKRLSPDPFEGDESPRVGEIQKLIRKYRTTAWDRTLREFPEVNKLYRRNRKIKSYRKAGKNIQSLLDY